LAENKYGILWHERGGEFTFSHPQVVAKVAEKITRGEPEAMWLANHMGQTKLTNEKTDNVFARVEVIKADKPELTTEEFAELDFPVLRIAMPTGRFKLYYPLSMKDNFSWEGRQWSEGYSDCYRLGLDYYAQQLGIKLHAIPTPKNYTLQMMTYAKTNLFVENFASSGFEQVLLPEQGDAVLVQSGMATFDGPDHVGIYLGDGKFLHHYRNRMSTIQPYSSMWRQKTTMVLRHTSRM
jgi:hypothetical protein|tara:strand:+ start:376 stop:1086 length:711 start_codon:yes stop_codon:yes gene_type:complete